MESKKARFRTGDIVLHKVNPSRKGPVIEVLPMVHGIYRYRVFHSPDDISEYLEEQISLCSTKSAKPVNSGKGLILEEFLTRLNVIRLSYPQTDSIYSLHSARIKFILFQFKPLLRFLRSPVPRLLIADEVGVGKTIEAGLILRELQSRQELKNILIMCPKALVLKWQAEMRRFDEDFRIITSETLRYCLKETYQDGIWPSQFSRSIIHLELLRREEYLSGVQSKKTLPGLFTLNPPPQFDLLIVDEAHHLKTTDSNSYKLAEFLCSISEAALFLTATPVQLGSRDLFALLHLLNPSQFIDETLFNEMVIPNKYINQAINCVRCKRPKNSWQYDSFLALENILKTSWGKGIEIYNPGLLKWLDRFKKIDRLTDEERIKFIRDMEEINTLSHIVNRTRRRDIGKFTIREPFTISISFTEEQRVFYNSLISYRKKLFSLKYAPNIINLIIHTLERQAASCLPAMKPLLDNFIRTKKFITTNITDDIELDDDMDIPDKLLDEAEELKKMASVISNEDPKLNNLIEIVYDTLNSTGAGKLLIFSYFLHTLSYLEQELSKRGFRVAVVNGKVGYEDREVLRTRFRFDRKNVDAIDILLSSEVGCEGLDYEFCSRLVNYDIPWNPMRIEQRIGRIDRFGQKSDKVQIYNFITPGTVEEKIFYRCYERLGIFKDTIGDMEEVLGELTKNLTKAALDPLLTIEQIEKKAQQLADNALRLIEEQRHLETESSELLGFDYFQEEIERINKEERFVTPDEVYQIVMMYIQARCKNVKIIDDSKQKKVLNLRANKEDKDKLLEDLYKLSYQDIQTFQLIRWLEGNESYLKVTFDQETALEQRDIMFITPIHILIKMAIAYWFNKEVSLFTQVVLKDRELKAGIYIFAYYLWEIFSLRKDIRLLSMVWNLEEDKLEKNIFDNLSFILKKTSNSNESILISQEKIDEILQKLEEKIYEKRFNELEELKQINSYEINHRLSSLDRYYERRLARISDALNTMTDKRILRMKEAEKNRVVREWEYKKQEIEEKKKTDIISRRVAFGILEIRGE